jgi:hypothetical protein
MQMMTNMQRATRWIGGLLLGIAMCAAGCTQKPPPQYGVEHPLFMPGAHRQIWAVAPVLNLSGENIDPILQADLLYEQLQQVSGLTVIPVNRVAEGLQSMHLAKLQSEQQASTLCDLLGADGIVVATITAYDPYNPPKIGAAVQLFRRGEPATRLASSVDPRQMARQPALTTAPNSTPAPTLIQVVGMYDAQNGSVRAALNRFAQGRNDPMGPYGAKQYLVDMDCYSGFVYHGLIAELLDSPKLRPIPRPQNVASSGD